MLQMIKMFKRGKIRNFNANKYFINVNAFSTSKTNEIVEQKLDCQSDLTNKLEILYHKLQTSKYPVIFTGAGVSTSCGIPDYRSPPGSVSPTGTGIWNRPPEERPSMAVLVENSVPSKTHKSIHKLVETGLCNFVVSGNTDGLHLKSGIERTKIAQLHGNRNKEICQNCGEIYYRAFRTVSTNPHNQDGTRNHYTGRFCSCGGKLKDTIVYFGQKLNAQDIQMTSFHVSKADLVICLGSSMSVKPSINFPLSVLQRGGHMVIVNLQKTPYDDFPNVLKLNSFTDVVMEKLCERLSLKIDKYRNQHYFRMKIKSSQSNSQKKQTQIKKENNSLQHENNFFSNEEIFEIDFWCETRNGQFITDIKNIVFFKGQQVFADDCFHLSVDPAKYLIQMKISSQQFGKITGFQVQFWDNTKIHIQKDKFSQSFQNKTMKMVIAENENQSKKLQIESVEWN